jgi:hypothetical protein
MISAQRTGIEPDAGAGRLFRLAALRLSEESADSDGYRVAAADAGAALVALALAEADDELRRLLTPDPADHNVVWTVACYQIGDLTPSALRDFADPVEAVATVAACPDETHVAAELVASTAAGLRWTAVSRTNDHLAVQLPTPETASDGSREHPGDLAAALRRWGERLGAWGDTGGKPAADVRSAPSPAAFSGAATALASTPASTSVGHSPMFAATAAADLDDRLDSLERRVAGLAGRQDLDAVDQSINSRLARLETSVAALVAGTEAANLAAARRDETVIQLEAELVSARSEISRPTLMREQLEGLQDMIDIRLRALATCIGDALRRFEDVATELEELTNQLADLRDATGLSTPADVQLHQALSRSDLGV